MHPVNLIARALALNCSDPEKPQMPGNAKPGICCVTGQEGPVIPRKILFGKSFTDGAVLAAPSSEWVSTDAAMALGYKWERMSSWLCDGVHFQRLDRQGVRAAVLGEPPERPWAGYATTSYKKHGALRARVNGPGRNIWLFENRLVDCSNRKAMEEVWGRLNHAIRQGFGRSILESLDCPGPIMAKQGAAYWLDFLAWAQPMYRSGIYQFMCYLLPSQVELKAEAKTMVPEPEPEKAPQQGQMELF